MKPIGRIVLLALVVLAAAAARAEEKTGDRLCFSPDRWEQILEKGGISVYSQKVPASDVLAFRAAGVLAAPVDQVMEVLRRLEITGEWMPDIRTKFAVKEFSDFEAVTYSINEMPWPFADREMLLYNRLWLDAVRRFLVVDVHSVEDEAVPVEKGNVRALMHCGETLVRPAGRDRTHVELILFVDPMGFIPAWLVNLSQRNLPYNFLKALEEKAAVTSFPLRPAYRKLLDALESMLKASR